MRGPAPCALLSCVQLSGACICVWLVFGPELRLTSRSAGADRTVTDHCGEVYKDCDICRVHPCQYHYNPTGMDAQAKVVAAAFRANLKKKRAVE